MKMRFSHCSLTRVRNRSWHCSSEASEAEAVDDQGEHVKRLSHAGGLSLKGGKLRLQRDYLEPHGQMTVAASIVGPSTT